MNIKKSFGPSYSSLLYPPKDINLYLTEQEVKENEEKLKNEKSKLTTLSLQDIKNKK